ncbi:hypothetical protein OHA72_09735 [Dactylosporangium sp. NBC_01737]|uniref:hypothetical protein n=1 Tax=Dactylosporangium sp. NBC_01737 TaxID=2975959 RepID=UPI002E0D8E83|nr:hypothetical protein OHA72_09735 [Dactylosporangium sp. NBC_01737]
MDAHGRPDARNRPSITSARSSARPERAASGIGLQRGADPRAIVINAACWSPDGHRAASIHGQAAIFIPSA